MARASTTPAQAPTAWVTRQPIIAPALPASAQPAEPLTNNTSPIATGPAPQRRLCGASTRRFWDASRDGPWRGALDHPFVPPGRFETVVGQQLTESAELLATLAERG